MRMASKTEGDCPNCHYARRQAADDMVDALYRLLPYPENGEEAKEFVAAVLEEFWREQGGASEECDKTSDTKPD